MEMVSGLSAVLAVADGSVARGTIKYSFSSSSGITLQRLATPVSNSTAKSSWRALSIWVRCPDMLSTRCSRTSG